MDSVRTASKIYNRCQPGRGIQKSGLAEGEIVVTSDNFKIDSAFQIQAKPSMMNPERAVVPRNYHGTENQVEVLKEEGNVQ